MAIARAPLIRDTLVAMDRSGSDVYEANTVLFLDELRALHERLLDLLRPLKNRKFLVYHPRLRVLREGLRHEADRP